MTPEKTIVTGKDAELLELVRCGDEQALVALYDRYSRLVYSVSFRILKDPVLAEDVLQEIFMRLWRAPGRLSVSSETVHGWLIVAARNRSISLLRKKCPDPLDDLNMASPFDLEKHSEQRLMCEKLINKLSPEQQSLLGMAFLKEMTHSEIASTTGYPLGTIKSRIRSALKAIRTAVIVLPKTAAVAAHAPLAGLVCRAEFDMKDVGLPVR